MNSFFKALLRMFPIFAKRGEWTDAKLVTNPIALARLDRVYAETAAFLQANYPSSVIAPRCEVTLRVWPEDLRPPKDFTGLLGKVLAPEDIPGDIHGTMLVRISQLANEALLAHEARHAITGESGHPEWLFPGYRS